MGEGFDAFISRASSVAGEVDALALLMLGLSAAVVLGIVVAIAYFSVKYRRNNPVDRSLLRRTLPIELTWTLMPLVAFVGLFVWSIHLFARIETPPADTLDDYIVAKQWMWKAQHTDGRREIDELHVPLGRAVRLTMISQDVIHSFYVPAFRVKQDVLPGRYTQLWFTPIEAGTFYLLCSEYCGTDHARMKGRVIVMRPADYVRWEEQGRPEQNLAARGEVAFRHYGCSGCHGPSATVHAPSLDGLYGKPVALDGGGTVLADDAYIRDSILLPAKQIAAGFAPIMPSFAGQVGEEDLIALIAYIRSRADVNGASP
jgi:cytochrome c oxidase subunit 2